MLPSRPILEKKMGVKRQKKMSSALLNLTRSVQELTEENQSLKEDLDRMLSNSPTVSKIKGTYLPAGHSQREHGETGRKGGAVQRWRRRAPSLLADISAWLCIGLAV